MNGLATEAVVELVTIVGSVLAAGLLTLGGVLTEQAGAHELLAGHSTLGAWEAGMGALLLYAGIYLVGYQQAWRRLRARRNRAE
jgi:hypothetical protein